MNDVTRYARVQPSMAPLRSEGGTRVPTLRVVRARSVEEEFRGSQRAMASAVREEPRRGLFVFAHHVHFGFIGRLWLEAGARPRAGTLGRHAGVDLALPLDEALSLRHALFVVRDVQGAVRLTVLDLASSRGLELEPGHPLRRFDVTGAAAVRGADFVLLCVPTGEALPWDPDAPDAWATFRAAAPLQPQPRERPRSGPRRQRKVAGCFTTWLGDLRSERAVTEGDLARGVLVGRHPRCDVRVPEGGVSRVHAALLRVDEHLLLVDAGSTNGLWRPDLAPVRCAPWGEGQPILLGHEAQMEWTAAH